MGRAAATGERPALGGRVQSRSHTIPTDPTQTYTDLLALEGVTLDPARAAGAAEVLRTQLEVERKATQALAFELEPSCFAATLRDASR